jgi:hypothetical protein
LLLRLALALGDELFKSSHSFRRLPEPQLVQRLVKHQRLKVRQRTRHHVRSSGDRILRDHIQRCLLHALVIVPQHVAQLFHQLGIMQIAQHKTSVAHHVPALIF